VTREGGKLIKDVRKSDNPEGGRETSRPLEREEKRRRSHSPFDPVTHRHIHIHKRPTSRPCHY